MDTFSNAAINTIVAALCFVNIGNKIGPQSFAHVILGELGGVKMRKKSMYRFMLCRLPFR